MTSISKIASIDKLDNIVNKYINTYQTAIEMKAINVKDNTSIDFGKKVNDKDPTLQVGNYVRISKYRHIFAKGYTPNWSEEVFVLSKIKNSISWTYFINNFKGE